MDRNGPDISLYSSCLQKVVTFLREGAYRSHHTNPFRTMPFEIINDIMSAILDDQRLDGCRADDLELLLTSGRVRKFEHETDEEELLQILNLFLSGCQELEVLHLTDCLRLEAEEERSDVSIALSRLLRNARNLQDLHSSFSFDLKALRGSRKLRSLRLHFLPRQPWCDFLAKEGDHFQPHQSLDFFSVCHAYPTKQEEIPYNDIVIILRHCPALTSLGYIESSKALAQLRKECMPPAELNLRHCYWTDRESDEINRVKEAVLYYPLIEELDFYRCSLRGIQCLNDLQNLVLLHITFDTNVNYQALIYASHGFGPRLKHLYFRAAHPVNVSLLLRNCPNLESFRFEGNIPMDTIQPASLSLPHLQRLTLIRLHPSGHFFPNLSNCNQLTELVINYYDSFNDATLYHFLQRNFLLNLKWAELQYCGLSERGFKELLLKSPKLERVEISDKFGEIDKFDPVASGINHQALCNQNLVTADEEFFRKRLLFYACGYNF